MQAGREAFGPAWRTRWRGSLGIAALVLPSLACAGLLEGSVTFPGRTIPASTIYARNLDSGVVHKVALRRSESSFRLELQAGRYWLFLRPQEPGLAELYGGHTRFSVCRSQPNASERSCSDHSLHAIEVPATGALAGITIDDWFLEETQAEELDRILGEAQNAAEESIELGRPRFSEYRAPAWESADRARLDITDERVTPFLEQLDHAAGAGANFAGRFALAHLECGVGCRQVAIVDLASGAVTLPEQIGRAAALPCRADRELVFRDDSRLLEHTHRDGTAVITDYLLWDITQRSFTTLAQYRRSLERFCGSSPQ